MAKGLPNYFLPVSIAVVATVSGGLKVSGAFDNVPVPRVKGLPPVSAQIVHVEEPEPEPVDEPEPTVTQAEETKTDTSDGAHTVASHDRRTLPFEGTRNHIVFANTSYDEGWLLAHLETLNTTIKQIEGEGRRVGLEIRDMESGRAVAYSADEEFYCASSIKGPFVASIYEELVDTGKVPAADVYDLARQIIIESDNDAYVTLSDRYGRQAFVDWAARCGAVKQGDERYQQLLGWRYAMLCPWQLDRMWQGIYAYLKSDSEGAKTLRELFEKREVSPLRDGLPEASATLTKAGWYPSDDGAQYAATADAGIVTMDGRDYVVVIMTDYAADLDRLTSLVSGLFSARETLE